VWPSLDPTKQNELLGEMTTRIVGLQPTGRREVMINYRQLGRVTGAEVGVVDANGTTRLWDPAYGDSAPA
jgi:hypothetical protein